MSIEDNQLKNILEAALMAMARPMSVEQLMKLFGDDERPSATRVKSALQQLKQDCEGRAIELKEVASGYRYQARQQYADWISRLWEERPARYSRAFLETLALIAYRQPVTRGEIEDVRGVGVSSSIIKTMLEREWIRVVGHRDVPGRPSLYATTKTFLDYFDMKSLDQLPSLAEIKDLDDLNPELNLEEQSIPGENASAQQGEAEIETETDFESDESPDTALETVDQPSDDNELDKTDKQDIDKDEIENQNENTDANEIDRVTTQTSANELESETLKEETAENGGEQ